MLTTFVTAKYLYHEPHILTDRRSLRVRVRYDYDTDC